MVKLGNQYKEVIVVMPSQNEC